MATYTAKDFSSLLGTPGFSDALLKSHFGLYEAYVKNANALRDRIGALGAKTKGDNPEYAELKRRFGWEFNGMRLHEYYFGNMTKTKSTLPKESRLAQQLAADYGSLDAWGKDFKETGKIRGIGWAALYWDPASGSLVNAWIEEHDAGHLAGGTPILLMDVFEHAFLADYGTKRADYIDAFWYAIDWTVVQSRFDTAPRRAAAKAH